MREEFNEVVALLAKRDCTSFEEAKGLLLDTLAEVEDLVAEGDFGEALLVWEQSLGLESDYLEMLLC